MNKDDVEIEQFMDEMDEITVKDLEEIADATGTRFRRNYILPNGEEI